MVTGSVADDDDVPNAVDNGETNRNTYVNGKDRVTTAEIERI